MRRKLLVPTKALDDIGELVSLSEKQLEDLYKILDSQFATSEKFGNIFIPVSDKLNISYDDAIDIVNAASNLEIQRKEYNINDEEFINELKQLFTEKNQPDLVKEIDLKKDWILKLTGPKPNADYFEKVRFIKTGLIDTAKSFRSFCDIRPIFDEQRTKYSELIPIIIMEVKFEDDERVIFQLNEDVFNKLKDFIEDTEKKLFIIKEDMINKLNIYKKGGE